MDSYASSNSSSKPPYLSVVVVSRNDNHGGDLTARTQAFVNSLAAMCCKFRLPAELVMVEWNPPGDRRPLGEELHWPESDGFLTYRLVQVPPELHNRLENSSQLPLYQMIGKNVGVRRARGEFVLATNVDLLFPDELGRLLAARNLKPGCFYRADRFDTPTNVLGTEGVPGQLDFCSKNILRVNAKIGTVSLTEWLFYKQHRLRWQIRETSRKIRERIFPFQSGQDVWLAFYPPKLVRALVRALSPRRIARALRPSRIYWALRLAFFTSRLHTNGCGDFTMLSRADWRRLRGYPEMEIFSWHIDSLFLYQASSGGLEEVILPAPIYHIEHKAGWSPEDADVLWRRLTDKKIPFLSNEQAARYRQELLMAGRNYQFNQSTWGMANHDLPEQEIVSNEHELAAA